MIARVAAPGVVGSWKKNRKTWLNVPADEALLFDLDRAKLWRASITKLGIDPGLLHATAGSA